MISVSKPSRMTRKYKKKSKIFDKKKKKKRQREKKSKGPTTNGKTIYEVFEFEKKKYKSVGIAVENCECNHKGEKLRLQKLKYIVTAKSDGTKSQEAFHLCSEDISILTASAK